MGGSNATLFRMIKNYHSGMKKYIPLIVISVAILAIIMIPFRAISYGYLPVDDALRHAAKVLSGKDWSQILVIRDDIRMDSHPGWHAVLDFMRRNFNFDQDGLVVFSVAALFILFALSPLFFIKRPEAWLATLLLFSASTGGMGRLFSGRPYIISMAALIIICLSWQDLKTKKFPAGAVLFFGILIALSAWAHGSWHLWALPALAFFLAREYRAAARFIIAAAAGIALGACLTGHPVLFLRQGLSHTMLAFGNNQLQRMLVSEFQPHYADTITAIIVCGFLVWRHIRGSWNIKCIDNPVFILAASGWVLNFFVCRFWLDWGMPAAMAWVALEFQDVFNGMFREYSRRRVVAAAAIAACLFISFASDINGRWTYNLTTEYLVEGDPKQREWLPEPGGIIYSNEMSVFYQTFFRNPRAPWRYALGFEPAWMRPDDLAIYRRIQWNYGAAQSFDPWVKKMRPQDRLVVRGSSESRPQVEGLEWYYAATNTWVGRLPRK